MICKFISVEMRWDMIQHSLRRVKITLSGKITFGGNKVCSSIKSLFWCLKQHFPQKHGPSHSSSPNIAINFLQQLGWITILHSTTSHFSSSRLLLDISSTIYMYGLFVTCKERLTRTRMSMRIQKPISSMRIFLSISQSDLVKKNQ